MSLAWLGIFSLIVQKKPNLYRGYRVWATNTEQHFHIRWIYSRRCKKKKKKKSVVHLNICSSVVIDQGSSLWTRWLDTRFTASTMRYARRRARSAFETLPSTGKPRCLSAMINAKSLKNRGNASEKLPARKVTEKKKHDCSGWGRCWIPYSFFPPHLSPDHPRCFVSQELWDLSLMRKLLLQQPHPALQAS